jgi:hypothetical protein
MPFTVVEAFAAFCSFEEYFSQRGFFVLRPGQRLDLLDIQAPKEYFAAMEKGDIEFRFDFLRRAC